MQEQSKDKSLEELFASALLKDSSEKLQQLISEKIDSIQSDLQTNISDIETSIKTKLDKLKKKVDSTPSTFNFGTTKKPNNRAVHKSFDTIMKILQSANRIEKNIMLVGACGSGKSSLCSDIAEALGIDFYPMSVGLQTTKSDLLGFINAKGDYITTPIRQAFENGGLLLLDEFDATHAGVITILNSMLANGICSFPDKIIKKHPNFICIVACNTYGNGGSIDYIGRNRLDSATLDRFITIPVDYDEILENKLVSNSKWLKIIKKMRNNIKELGLKIIISPRASMQGADLLDSGMPIEDVVNMCIFKGCGDDVKNGILKGINLEKYYTTTKKTKQTKEQPIDITIDFDNHMYSCENVSASFSILAQADWDAQFSIFVSSRNEWIPCIENNEIFFNCGKHIRFNSYSQEQIELFINSLIAYADTTTLHGAQPIKIKAVYRGVQYDYKIG